MLRAIGHWLSAASVGLILMALAQRPGLNFFSSVPLRVHQAAMYACLEGMRYAVSHLAHDSGWQAGEGTGTVSGTVRTPAGPAEFRLRFSSGSRYACINNLNWGGPVGVARALGTLGPDTPCPYEVPGFTACILVEGWSRQAGLGAHRVAQAYLRPAPGLDDAVLAAGGDVHIVLTGRMPVTLEAPDPWLVPRIRCKGALSIEGGPTVQLKSVGPASLAVGPRSTASVGGGVSVGGESPAARSLALGWRDLRPLSRDCVRLPAGTYVAGPDGLRYYDTDQDWHTVPAHPVPDLPDGLEATAGHLTVRRDVQVEPTRAARGLAWLGNGLTLEGSPGHQVQLRALGNVRIQGGLQGRGGSLEAGGNLTVEPGPGGLCPVRVCLYAGGDIRLDSASNPLQWEGALYALGDVRLECGTGALQLQGTLTAFGGQAWIRAGEVRLMADPACLRGLQVRDGPVEGLRWMELLPDFS